MGLRILTGVLVPRQTSGNATIHFHPHEVTGDADGVDLQAAGAKDYFKQPPNKVVSLRHFTVQDRNRAFGKTGIEIEQFQIEDHDPSTHRMVVRWRATNGAEIKEISYMIIGAV